jgi:hypothetical protein
MTVSIQIVSTMILKTNQKYGIQYIHAEESLKKV